MVLFGKNEFPKDIFKIGMTTFFGGHYDTFACVVLLRPLTRFMHFTSFGTFFRLDLINTKNLNLFLMKILTYLANPYIYKYYLYHLFTRKTG